MLRKSFLTAALLCTPALWATEEAMNQALSVWQQHLTEYEAAVAQAPTPEAKAAVVLPDGSDVAPLLWQSVAAKTGTRTEEVKVKKQTKKRVVDTYEFEQPWAAPAVAWLLNHPHAFAAVFGGKKKSVSYFADALMSSLEKVHYAHPAMKELCTTLTEGNGAREYEILQKIYNNNTDKDTRACAALSMSLMLNSPMIAGVEGSEAMTRAKRLYYLKQALLLSNDQTMYGNTPLMQAAEQQIYFLKHLAPGCVAQQVTLTDMQGAAHTFPQPGKAHLILFWTPEEATGAKIVEGIGKLKQQYPDLEVVPVMPHADSETVQQLQESGVTTYFDNAEGAAGNAYRIASVPSAVFTNKTCAILYSGFPNMELQTAMDKELGQKKKAEEAAKPKVVIAGNDAPAAPQPKAEEQPAPAAATPQPADDKEQAPALREMPKF